MTLSPRLRVVSIALVVTGGAALYACGGDAAGAAIGDADGGGPDADGSAPAVDGGGSTSDGPLPDDDSGTHTVPAGGACTRDSDCVTGGCDYTLHCALARSCTQHNGGDTCGPNGDESCCTTLAVPKPSAPYKLDKFNITAGRFRVFIEKTKGDVRGYIQKNRPTWFEPAWDAWIPNVMDDGVVVTGLPHLYSPGQGQDGVYQQLGPSTTAPPSRAATKAASRRRSATRERSACPTTSTRTCSTTSSSTRKTSSIRSPSSA